MTDEERMSYEAFVAERRAQIMGLVGQAAARAGRDVSEVTVLGVSKTVDVDKLVCAWRAGYAGFAENRPQELRRKAQAIAQIDGMQDVRLDMIGNLQTNKVKQVVGVAHLIHSVSSLHLAEAISKRAVADALDVRALLEVNVSGEQSKGGFTPTEVTEQLDELLALPGLSIEGLMAMAPAHDSTAARATFSGVRELRDELRVRSGLPLDTLSCGMSDDFGIAVEEGSTLVRLGRVVFDPAYSLGV